MGFWQGASTGVEKVDSVFLVILALSVLFLLAITATMIAFVLKYARKRHPKAQATHENPWLEITWTLIPLIMFLGMFYFGWTNFSYIRNAPRDAMVVKVYARQWAWSFEYPNGRQAPELYAALGKPLKLEVTSKDVIHGFYVPAFRLKIDAVPGKVNTTWFEPTQVGSYDIECTVICGPSHSYMLSKVVVVPEEEFKRWYFGSEDGPAPGQAAALPAPAPPVSSAGAEPAGLVLLRAQNCLKCHSTDGSVRVGPTFKGLYGSRETVVSGRTAREVVLDDPFLLRAIREPHAETLKGYPPAMPKNSVSEREAAEILDYLKTLK